MKTHRLLPLATALALLPSLAQAACYAEYKAKREDPLKLHYGVAEIDGTTCTPAAANEQLPARLAKDDWILLSVVAMIDETGLEAAKSRAGAFFLKY